MPQPPERPEDYPSGGCADFFAPPLYRPDPRDYQISARPQWSEMRELLECLGKRQEELFSEVLKQQKDLHSQVLAMQSTSKIESAPLGLDKTVNGMKTNQQQGDDMKTDEQFGLTPENITPEVITPLELEQLKVDSDATVKGSPTKSSDSEQIGTKVSKSRKSSGLQLHHVPTLTLEEGTMFRLKRLLKSKELEVVIAGAILLNALVIFWECQYQGLHVGFRLKYPGRELEADIVWKKADVIFDVFEWCFGILFLVEMLAKLACFRQTYFFDSAAAGKYEDQASLRPWKRRKRQCVDCLRCMQAWNLLDFACVLAFLFGKAAPEALSLNPQMLRLLRLFRLFRLVRLLRFLETLGHLYVMTTAISGMSKVLTWAIVLLTIMLLATNLFLVQILQATYFSKVTESELGREELKQHHKVYEYFGTCTRCMLSMFEITLGNWPPVARILSENVSQWFSLFCVMHKLTIGFAVVGVITGVILQETFKVAQTDDLIMFRQKKAASRVLRRKMKLLFDSLDEQGDGQLPLSEFVSIGKDPEIKLWLSSLDIETDDLTTLFHLIDEDGSGYITLDELMARVPRIKGAARSIDMLSLQRGLQNFKFVDTTCAV